MTGVAYNRTQWRGVLEIYELTSERERERSGGMSPVCASIDIIPLRRDKIELKSKTGYYLSAKTFFVSLVGKRRHSWISSPDNDDSRKIGGGRRDIRGSLKSATETRKEERRGLEINRRRKRWKDSLRSRRRSAIKRAR